MHTDIATANDIDTLVALLGLLFAQETEFRPDRELQRAGLCQILVLRQNDRILGMVNLLYTVSTALGGKVALLEDMVIEPAQRNRGAGTRLLGDAIEHARRAGCLRITLLTDDDNIDAQRFYRHHGFSPSAMQAFRLLLPGAAEPS